MNKPHSFPDRNQNFWQLASIGGTALGIPGMIIGGQLANEYSPGIAFVSICIGNLILWIAGIGIISIAPSQNHAIENVKRYLGNKAGIIASLVLVFAFLFWYIYQIKGAAIAFNSLFQTSYQWEIGLALGLMVAAISFGGIRVIKQICVFGLPALFCFSLYSMATAPHTVSLKGTFGFSFSAIISVMFTWLPGTVNLPTLFRHSKSKADSILAISLIALFHTFFQTVPIIIGLNNPSAISSLLPIGIGYTALTAGLVLLIFACINLINIYFASVGWETIIPHRANAIEYTLVGLLGTIGYVLSQISSSYWPSIVIEIWLNYAGTVIGILGITLLVGFLFTILTKHRHRSIDRLFNSMCWLIGCIAAMITQNYVSSESHFALITGASTCLLCFLLLGFIEETIWSIKNLQSMKR